MKRSFELMEIQPVEVNPVKPEEQEKVEEQEEETSHFSTFKYVLAKFILIPLIATSTMEEGLNIILTCKTFYNLTLGKERCYMCQVSPVKPLTLRDVKVLYHPESTAIKLDHNEQKNLLTAIPLARQFLENKTFISIRGGHIKLSTIDVDQQCIYNSYVKISSIHMQHHEVVIDNSNIAELCEHLERATQFENGTSWISIVEGQFKITSSFKDEEQECRETLEFFVEITKDRIRTNIPRSPEKHEFKIGIDFLEPMLDIANLGDYTHFSIGVEKLFLTIGIQNDTTCNSKIPIKGVTKDVETLTLHTRNISSDAVAHILRLIQYVSKRHNNDSFTITFSDDSLISFDILCADVSVQMIVACFEPM